MIPEGIVYDLKNHTFRTDRVNVILMLMAQPANNAGAKVKEQTNALMFSLSAGCKGQLSNYFIEDMRAIIAVFRREIDNFMV